MAVSVAADSAVTHVCNNGKEKVWNTARKIFQLIPGQPVGVAICGNAEIMSVPMELILGLYGQASQDKSFGTLLEYAQDFVSYVKSASYLQKEEDQHGMARNDISHVWEVILKEADKEMAQALERGEHPAATPELRKEFLKKEYQNFIEQFKSMNRCEDFQDYTFKQFRAFLRKDLATFFQKEQAEKEFPEKEFRPLLERAMFYYIVSNSLNRGTQFIFFGYGQEEIYPVVLPMEVQNVLDNRLRWAIDKGNMDRGDDGATVFPFGQSGVVRTVINGVSNGLLSSIHRKWYNALTDYKEQLRREFHEWAGEATELKNCLDQVLDSVDVDKIDDDLGDSIRSEIQDTRSENILDVLDSYGPEGLARCVEDLVAMAEFTSRTSGDTESVQGPIDVAVITKVGGFRWEKRK